MISFVNAPSSHSGLIPLKNVYKKRGEFLWAIASKKNFLTCMHSPAFVTVFARNLTHAYKFRIMQKPLDNFFINLTISKSFVSKFTLQVSRTFKTGKAFKQGLQYNQFFPEILSLPGSVPIIHLRVSRSNAQTWEVSPLKNPVEPP